MLLRNRQLHDGDHLRPVARRMQANNNNISNNNINNQQSAATTTSTTAASKRPRRYLLKIKTSVKPWATAGAAVMGDVFGTEQLGRDATTLF